MFANFAADVAGLVDREYAAGRLPVLSLSSSFAPADIARGAEDARYVTLAAALNATGKNIWVGILPEMNGEWNACARSTFPPARAARSTRRRSSSGLSGGSR